MILKSESEKRIIVSGTINGKKAYMLVDTGAVAGIMDKSAVKEYGLKVNKNKKFSMEGAGGKFNAYLCETPLVLGDKLMYQFLVADISNLVKSIHRDTLIEIAGIISLSQMRGLNIEINTANNYINIG